MDEASSSGTVTQRLQAELESAVGSLFEAYGAATTNERLLMLTLHHDEHEEYVVKGLRRLSAGYSVLDSSRPWMCYWILHSLALLGRPVDEDLHDRTIDFLEHCQDPHGGYAGGPGQMPHLATTYAATCALVTLGGEKALSSINRKKILRFLLRMKDPCGGFRVHEDGEMDMRGCFSALAVAHLLDIMVPELVENVAEHVRSCQTYEGGIGGEPGAEAHGGYTFCGLAAVSLINQLHVLDLPSLVNWVAFRQGSVEGGFQGRTNKLVDGCYSFWQGGCFQLLQQHMPELLAQQITSVAALRTPQDEVKSANSDPSNTKDPKQLLASESKEESSGDVLEEAQGDEPKLANDGLSCIDGFMDKKDEASQAMFLRPSSQASMAKANELIAPEVEASEEFVSPTKDISSKGWHSDEDEVEYWDLDSKTRQYTAEKLFTMAEGVCWNVPSHTKIVDLADDSQGAPGGDSGSTRNSSAVDLGSWDDILHGPFFNSQALQAYILLCCQVKCRAHICFPLDMCISPEFCPFDHAKRILNLLSLQDLDGGLRDKPGKPCDFYHTCYCLSGLAAAQYSTAHRIGAPPPPSGVLGPYNNLLEATHAICNVRLDRYYESQSYFKRNKETLDV